MSDREERLQNWADLLEAHGCTRLASALLQGSGTDQQLESLGSLNGYHLDNPYVRVVSELVESGLQGARAKEARRVVDIALGAVSLNVDQEEKEVLAYLLIEGLLVPATASSFLESTTSRLEDYHISQRRDSFKQLETDLEQAQELLEATKRRLHELHLKKAALDVAFPAGEAAELRRAEEEARELEEKIHYLEVQVQSEEKRSSDGSDSHAAIGR